MAYEKRNLSEEIESLAESFKRINWQAMTTFGFDNSVGTTIYDFQVEFMYLYDTATRDSNFIANKTLPRIRALISEYRDACIDAKKAKEKE